MKLAITSLLIGSAAAFAPSASTGASSSALRMSETTTEETTTTNGEAIIAGEAAASVEESPFVPAPLTINIAEALRASTGWVEPGMGPLFSLRETYYPGDIGFDPIGLKPKDAKDFANMQTKELSN